MLSDGSLHSFLFGNLIAHLNGIVTIRFLCFDLRHHIPLIKTDNRYTITMPIVGIQRSHSAFCSKHSDPCFIRTRHHRQRTASRSWCQRARTQSGAKAFALNACFQAPAWGEHCGRLNERLRNEMACIFIRDAESFRFLLFAHTSGFEISSWVDTAHETAFENEKNTCHQRRLCFATSLESKL